MLYLYILVICPIFKIFLPFSSSKHRSNSLQITFFSLYSFLKHWTLEQCLSPQILLGIFCIFRVVSNTTLLWCKHHHISCQGGLENVFLDSYQVTFPLHYPTRIATTPTSTKQLRTCLNHISSSVWLGSQNLEVLAAL